MKGTMTSAESVVLTKMDGRIEAVTSMVSIGARIFAATLSLLHAGSFGAVGYLLGRQGVFQTFLVVKGVKSILPSYQLVHHANLFECKIPK